MDAFLNKLNEPFFKSNKVKLLRINNQYSNKSTNVLFREPLSYSLKKESIPGYYFGSKPKYGKFYITLNKNNLVYLDNNEFLEMSYDSYSGDNEVIYTFEIELKESQSISITNLGDIDDDCAKLILEIV